MKYLCSIIILSMSCLMNEDIVSSNDTDYLVNSWDYSKCRYKDLFDYSENTFRSEILEYSENIYSNMSNIELYNRWNFANLPDKAYYCGNVFNMDASILFSYAMRRADEMNYDIIIESKGDNINTCDTAHIVPFPVYSYNNTIIGVDYKTVVKAIPCNIRNIEDFMPLFENIVY